MESLIQPSSTRLQPVCGQYRLMSMEWVFTPDAECYRQVVLETAFSRTTAELWDDAVCLPDIPEYGLLVEASISNQQTASAPQVDNIRIIHPDEVINSAALLPRSLCPEQAYGALNSLVRVIDWMPIPPLRRFLNQVLADPEIGIAYMRSRASHPDHHNFIGGLLVHSMDVAKVVASYRFRISPIDLSLAVVGALLHDLGKICTNGDGVRRLLLWKLRHESFTLQLLGAHLMQLSKEWPQGGSAMNYIFQYLHTSRDERPYAELIAAQLIEDADRFSVACWKDRSFKKFERSLPTPCN